MISLYCRKFESGESRLSECNGKKIKGTKVRWTRDLKHKMKMEKRSKYKMEKSMLLRFLFPQFFLRFVA